MLFLSLDNYVIKVTNNRLEVQGSISGGGREVFLYRSVQEDSRFLSNWLYPRRFYRGDKAADE
jgi:hypothetical protein